ncbi:hypothetical protein KI809_08515 [Geobacter pelophilus]|uniref:Uncharacterized protein n=1 Tax=Geoanaerobacter pelophilus TaxID=60036 RepID=A0AAW4L929_9BACT|nr:hypothetical protein [Geoanaerobacter pelophilus]MBT0664342.1 hypothetical protein [Geoanaerobacter pelophilus]
MLSEKISRELSEIGIDLKNPIFFDILSSDEGEVLKACKVIIRNRVEYSTEHEFNEWVKKIPDLVIYN